MLFRSTIARGTIESTGKSNASLQKAIDVAETNVATAKKNLEAHMTKDTRIDASDDTEKLEAEKEAATGDIATFDEMYQVRLDEANADKERIMTRLELDEARDALVLCKSLVKIIGTAGILGAVLAAALNPMTEVIDECLPAKRECFIDTAGKDFKIGMTIDGEARSLMSLSDGEKSLFAAAVALSFMILQRSNLKLLIINRFESIDATRQRLLLESIVQIAEKYGIQFIACSCHGAPAVEGVTIIDMGGVE